jgi:hypothetical protein
VVAEYQTSNMDSSVASEKPTKHASKPEVQGWSSGPKAFHLRVLIKQRPGVYSHYTLQCSTDGTLTDVFDNLRRLHREHVGVRWHHLRCVAHLFLMQRISIGTARTFEVNPTQHLKSNGDLDCELTFRRHNPSILKTNDILGFCISRIIHMMTSSLPLFAILLL